MNLRVLRLPLASPRRAHTQQPGPLGKFSLIGWMCAAWALTPVAQAQTPPDVQTPPSPSVEPNSELDAELFYQLLVGEMQLRSGEPGAGYSLVLDAARKNGQPELYRRAIEIALMARSGEAALSATRIWAAADPSLIEPVRYELQILMALERPAEIGPALGTLLRLTPAASRLELIAGIPGMLSRASDKRAVLAAATPVLTASTQEPDLAAAAWASLGRLRLLSGQEEAAFEAARRALTIDPQSVQAGLLALVLIEQGMGKAEDLISSQLTGPSDTAQPQVRLEYARLLLDQKRYLDAAEQLRRLTQQSPELPEGWLLTGALQLQRAQPASARTALQRYLELSTAEATGRNQAYLMMAQAAEKLNLYREAEDWLGRVTDADPALIKMRRASLLARQGRVTEARALLRDPAAASTADLRRQWLAEAQLLRDLGQYREVLKIYREAAERYPDDHDLAYEWAVAAEKAGQPREMERVLRDLLARKPDHVHALNALGYHLADHNERLPEARELIRRALELTPNDPFILDSMGWVEYRLGKLTEARLQLELAWSRRPDPEIAAHLGEVLWVSGQRDEALHAWRRGLQLGQDNPTLSKTLARFKVKP